MLAPPGYRPCTCARPRVDPYRLLILGRMRATLIYNAGSGGSGSLSSDTLQEALLDVGLNPVYRSTATERDLDVALADPGDVVLVAGGDGTVRAVATRLAGRGVPIAILPMGTANNIAGTLGLTGGPLDQVAGLANPRPRPFDLGLVRGPWGEDYFLEAVGVGLFASVMATYDPEAGKSPLRALGSVVQTLTGWTSSEYRLELDGQLITGRFLLVEAMNAAATGPRLRLAPGADPSDGLLDVVLVEDDDRTGFATYLTNILTGHLGDLPNVNVRRARRIVLDWDGSPLHLDAEVRPQPRPRPEEAEPAGGATPDRHDPRAPLSLEAGRVEIEVLAGALELWLPGPPTEVQDPAAGEPAPAAA